MREITEVTPLSPIFCWSKYDCLKPIPKQMSAKTFLGYLTWFGWITRDQPVKVNLSRVYTDTSMSNVVVHNLEGGANTWYSMVQPIEITIALISASWYHVQRKENLIKHWKFTAHSWRMISPNKQQLWGCRLLGEVDIIIALEWSMRRWRNWRAHVDGARILLSSGQKFKNYTWNHDHDH